VVWCVLNPSPAFAQILFSGSVVNREGDLDCWRNIADYNSYFRVAPYSGILSGVPNKREKACCRRIKFKVSDIEASRYCLFTIANQCIIQMVLERA
jgi:hypothetical protein